ncbi:SDR family oxidoreductase [Noviherbaspirillum galbum]|uniref:SDR family oxidoreductase n=1 Tax=Noviherbaspirillum galbum TaxID=2709383 RepID=A0A6B3SMX2_9BURK|nr:SDR family oxidoreductase [Noviherbaspirillum galbum]NEX62093.1 SDR family oxidoreductase [Noviherbaspirillum galbum]
MPAEGSHVVIVGGASGIGLSIAKTCAALGASVTISGRDVDRGLQVAAGLGGSVRFVQIDLLESDSIKRAFEGNTRIDHLVLTPVYPGNQSLREFDVEEAMRALRLKLVAFPQVVKAALPRLKSTSSITVFGGLAKANPYPGSTMVSIANGGVVGMVRTLAVELAPIRVNCISPGLVEDSPRWQARIAAGAGAAVEAFKMRTPSQKLANVEDIVHGVLFLMDNRAANGIDLELDGGIQLV